MPRLMTEKSKSPERISHHLRSTPIAIPKRRRTASSLIESPGRQLDSPDLVFEMSPISPDFPATTKHAVSPSSEKGHDPFMYCAPSLRHHSLGTKTQLRTKKSCQRVMPSRNTTTVLAGADSHHLRQTKTSLSHDALVLNPQADGYGTTYVPSTTKITGFSPLIEHQPFVFDEPSKPSRPLPPPPRRPSFSSSPWILPGRGGSQEGDVSYSQTDPSVFEFRNHLLGRIENQDSSRFKSLHSCL